MGSILKNRYTYTMLSYVHHAEDYGMLSAVRKALSGHSVPNIGYGGISRQDILSQLFGCEAIMIEPEDVLFTSLPCGVEPRRDMQGLVSELQKRGVKIYLPKSCSRFAPVLEALSYTDISFEDKALPLVSCRDGADIRIPPPAEMFEKSSVYPLLKRFVKKNRELFALITGKGIYSSPFCGTISEPYILGYALIAPLLCAFTDFAAELSEKYKRLFFLSREGSLLKQLYDMRCGGDTEYLLVSRRAVSMACVKEKEDMERILSSYYKGSVKNLLYSRFGIACGIEGDISLPEEKARALDIIKPYEDRILASAREERRQYLKYLDSAGFSEGCAVVDVGYRGSIQYFLSKLTGIATDGIYLSSLYDALPERERVKSAYPVRNAFELPGHAVYPHHLLLEAALKAPHGQLLCFSGGKPVFGRGGESDKTTEEIQEGIKAFFADHKGRVDREAASEILNAFILCGTVDKALSDRLYVEDSYCSDEDKKLSVGS